MKYLDVVANAIMLQNVVDLTDVLNAMAEDGFAITPELVASLSPYMREHILRFGRLMIDMDDVPKPLQPKSVPIVLHEVTIFYTYYERTPTTYPDSKRFIHDFLGFSFWYVSK